MKRFCILLSVVMLLVLPGHVSAMAPTVSGSLPASMPKPALTIQPSLPQAVNAPAVGNNLLIPSQSNLIDAKLAVGAPVHVAFNAVPNRYSDVDPATTFDLNGDLVGDLSVGADTVTGKNGALVQLIEPAVFSLDQISSVPPAGYAATASAQLSRVYVMKLPAGGYAKFMLLQKSPKVTIWFHYGTVTTSLLQANGQGGHAVLSWGSLPDAALGYNVYRYEFLDNNAYSVTLLNDFTIKETTFTDNTALNHYYLYVVIAIKNNGSFGAQTTVAPVNVQSVQRNLVMGVDSNMAKLDGANLVLAKKTVIKNGRMMVPASVFSNIGVKVTFDSASEKLTLSRRLDNVTYTIVMTVNEAAYTWNGNEYKADVLPYKDGNEVMVPARVAAPGLAYGLSFNSSDTTATVQWFE